jgi:hypothetical protein
MPTNAERRANALAPRTRGRDHDQIDHVSIGVDVAAITVFALFESCKNGDFCGSDHDG